MAQEIALARLERQLPTRQFAADRFQTIEVDGQANRVKTTEILWLEVRKN
jgi:hypothetical protein